MPRFTNLKGSMNPFDNNKPVLNSSDRTRNKKSKYIYAAAKQKFQTKRRCNGKNIKYYKKGMVRSVANYKLQQDLAIGNALCEDCDNRGTLCGSTMRANLNKIEMGNNKVSEFWGGGGIDPRFGTGTVYYQTPSFPVIQTDISGVWNGPYTTDINKSDLARNTILPGSDPPQDMPYGYIKNLIKIPRNLDGTGIVIDPSNILFPNNSCGHAPYLKFSNLKTYITVSAIMPIHGQEFDQTATPGSCNDPSYNLLVNTPVYILSYPTPVITGVIKSVCCKRNMYIKIMTAPYTFAPEGEFGLFDINIEVLKIIDYAQLSLLINYKPQFFNNIADSPLFPEPGWPGTSGWVWCPSGAFGAGDCRGPILITMGFQGSIGQPQPDQIVWSWMIESVKMTQGTIEPSYNQTKYNATKQSYLSCLEDGTKKINFTKNTIKNKIVKGYCKQ